MDNLSVMLKDLVILKSSTGKFSPFIAVDSGAITRLLSKAVSDITGSKVYASGKTINDPELVQILEAKGVRIATSSK